MPRLIGESWFFSRAKKKLHKLLGSAAFTDVEALEENESLPHLLLSLTFELAPFKKIFFENRRLMHDL